MKAGGMTLQNDQQIQDCDRNTLWLKDCNQIYTENSVMMNKPWNIA
jgi:hypothetical protein